MELTGNSALIRWSSQTPTSGVRMFQVQYNSSGDDALVYRSVFSRCRFTICLSDLSVDGGFCKSFRAVCVHRCV